MTVGSITGRKVTPATCLALGLAIAAGVVADREQRAKYAHDLASIGEALPANLPPVDDRIVGWEDLDGVINVTAVWPSWT